MAFIEAVIGDRGEDIHPLEMLKEIEKARSGIDVRGRDALRRQLKLMAKLVSKTERLLPRLVPGHPLFLLLESRRLSEDLLIPWLVVLLNVLSQVKEGDPLRWFLIDEINKLVDNPIAAAFLIQMATEVRHRPVSVFMNGQKFSNLPPSLVGLATVIAVFKLTNPYEVKRGQELSGLVRGPSFQDFFSLEKGHCLLASMKATQARYRQEPQRVIIRPTALMAGGASVEGD